MGVVEFVIPTDVLSNILVSNEYIKWSLIFDTCEKQKAYEPILSKGL
jgi:hypothetical protein